MSHDRLRLHRPKNDPEHSLTHTINYVELIPMVHDFHMLGFHPKQIKWQLQNIPPRRWPYTLTGEYMLSEIEQARREAAAVLRKYRSLPQHERVGELAQEAQKILGTSRMARRLHLEIRDGRRPPSGNL